MSPLKSTFNFCLFSTKIYRSIPDLIRFPLPIQIPSRPLYTSVPPPPPSKRPSALRFVVSLPSRFPFTRELAIFEHDCFAIRFPQGVVLVDFPLISPPGCVTPLYHLFLLFFYLPFSIKSHSPCGITFLISSDFLSQGFFKTHPVHYWKHPATPPASRFFRLSFLIFWVPP